MMTTAPPPAARRPPPAAAGVRTHGPADDGVHAAEEVFADYVGSHTGSRVDVVRWNDSVVTARVIDPAFRGMTEFDRNDRVWDFLDARADPARTAELSFIVKVAPGEERTHAGNLEFEDRLAELAAATQ